MSEFFDEEELEKLSPAERAKKIEELREKLESRLESEASKLKERADGEIEASKREIAEMLSSIESEESGRSQIGLEDSVMAMAEEVLVQESFVDYGVGVAEKQEYVSVGFEQYGGFNSSVIDLKKDEINGEYFSDKREYF